MRSASILALAILMLPAALPATTVPPEQLPEPLREVGFDQRLDGQVPLDLVFADEAGRRVELGDYFGERPVVLALVYYECPMLCTLVLNGLTSGLKPLALTPGEDFEIVAVSFDPSEGPELAAAKKRAQTGSYGRAGSERGWHFLTGEQQAIERLTESVGFRYAWDEASGQFAHASGVVILTPEGRISRYLFGVEYAPRDLRLGLVESAAGAIGSLVDQVLLFCYHYDPATGRYSAAAMNLVRLGGAVTVLALALYMIVMLRRERRRPSSSEA